MTQLVAPRAVFKSLEGHRFPTKVKSAEALEVRRARRFTRPGAAVTLVDADWHLLVDFRFQDSDTNEPEKWGRISDVTLHGRLQVYLPDPGDDDDHGQLIAAQLSQTRKSPSPPTTGP